ncbi:MAG: hypothetical protein PUD50_07980 [Eubacteriales bacterium]|nr:hypothetical protein [Eubacteriales bacterium]
MKKADRLLPYAFEVLMIASLLIVGILLNSEDFSRVDKLDGKDDRGAFLILDEEVVPREDVETFLVSDGFLFLFYDDVGIVNVYTVDGAFQYGIQIFTSTSGCGAMNYSDGLLYIESRLNVRYVFEKKICKQCIICEYRVNEEEYKRLDPFFEDVPDREWDGASYSLSSDQSEILRIRQDGTETVVLALPKKNPYVYTFLAASAMFAFAASQLRKKERQLV